MIYITAAYAINIYWLESAVNFFHERVFASLQDCLIPIIISRVYYLQTSLPINHGTSRYISNGGN